MAIPFRRILLIGAVLGGGGYAAYIASLPQPIPVDLLDIRRAPMEVTINADGITRIRDVYEISAPVSGLALRSPVSVGDAVIANETVVAVVEPGEPAFLDARSRSQAEAAVREAEAALHLSETNIIRAEADLEYARNQLERLQALHQRGTVSDSQMDEANLAVRLREAQVSSALAEREMTLSTLERSRAMLIQPNELEELTDQTTCCFPITSPISGHVLSVSNPSRRMVAAGTPLASIGQIGDLEIAVDLLSTDAVRLRPGASAYVEGWGGDAILQAELREMEPAAFTKISALGIEEQRVRAVLDFRSGVEDRDGLGHEFRVFVRIVEWKEDRVLQVPISALFREGDDWAVFVEDQGIAHLRIIRIGHRNSETAEILGGLDTGERVVAHPSDRISENVLIADRQMLEEE